MARAGQGAAGAGGRKRVVLSFDVEEWHDAANLRPFLDGRPEEARQDRVEAGLAPLLALLARTRSRATFFVLGRVAERRPDLVREIARGGHEVACHGYGHRDLTAMGTEEFREDLRRARRAVEAACGVAPAGYRAPSFTMRGDLLGVLREEGFSYDSSLLPATVHDRYGRMPLALEPGRVAYRTAGGVVEIVLAAWRPLPGVRVPVGGGGWFRLYPYAATRWIVDRLPERDVVTYFHPWEFDPGQPRVAGGLAGWRHRVGTEGNLVKLRRLLDEYPTCAMDVVLGEEVKRDEG